MHYSFNITLTEDDYITFNLIHTFDTVHGKKAIRNIRLLFIGILLLFAALEFFSSDQVDFTYIAVYLTTLCLLAALYMLFLKRITRRILEMQVKRMKKTGKLPYDEVASFEFYDDKFVDFTPAKRSEQSYAVLEQIYIVKNQYVLLYVSSASAYIFPISQLQEQVNLEELIGFLSQKCDKIICC